MKKWIGLWLVAMVIACGKSSNNDTKTNSKTTTGGTGITTTTGGGAPVNPNTPTKPGDSADKTGPASRFIGRVSTNAVTGTLMAWPATSYTAAFKGGTEYKVVFEAANPSNANRVAIFNAFVDGNKIEQDIRVVGMPGPQEFKIPVSGSGEHTVLLIKRTDSHIGSAYFKSGEPVGGTASNLPALTNRLVEFVGDVYVSGSGNLGTDPAAKCSSDANFQDATVAFPAITAQTLGVDWSVVSSYYGGLATDVSGESGSTAWTGFNMYPNAGFEPAVPYAFTTPANVVVILLGASDYYTSADKQKKIPNQAVMVEAYTKLLNQVVEKNPEAFVLLAVPPNLLDNSPNGLPVISSYRAMLDAVVQAMNNPKISIHNFTGTTVFNGCDYFPDVNAHRAMAASLVEKIKSLTSW